MLHSLSFRFVFKFAKTSEQLRRRPKFAASTVVEDVVVQVLHSAANERGAM